jgi:sulfate adenylyltransferase subunit 1 (EFTu-like GTPase family)
VPDDIQEIICGVRRPDQTVPQDLLDYSLLTDGLAAERQQGITIDVAYRHLLLPSGRRLVFADAPRHEAYTRNMVVAASMAHGALLLVDAARGMRA